METSSIVMKPSSLGNSLTIPFLTADMEDMGPVLQAFTASFSMIIISELGDKTFILSAIMAMENSRALVFFASASALALMTILSVVMGVAVTIIPRVYTHYGSMILFFFFGIRMLFEAYSMESEEKSEFEEVKKSLEEEKKHQQQSMKVDAKCSDCNNNDVILDPGSIDTTNRSWILSAGPLVIKVFTMTFLAEWGDRSQISTVVLAARDNIVGVFSGALLGHLLCTGLAVMAGRLVADLISVRTMTILGGLTFLAFTMMAVIDGPQ